MAEKTLVEDRIRDARRLINALAREGFEIHSSGWLKDGDSGNWNLYIAAPYVNEHGSLKAYKFVRDVLEKNPMLDLDIMDMNLISTNSATAKLLYAERDKRLGGPAIHLFAPELGALGAVEAVIYPPSLSASEIRQKPGLTPDEVILAVQDHMKRFGMSKPMNVKLRNGQAFDETPTGMDWGERVANVHFAVNGSPRIVPANDIQSFPAAE